jgi:acyl dehydratase
MVRLAASAKASVGGPLPELPGPELRAVVPARNNALVDDYIQFVKGDPRAYRGVLPAHFFPQWGFPLLTKALHGIPYDLSKVVNAGCRMEIHAPIPRDEPLELSARLIRHEERGTRALIAIEMTTSTKSAPNALVTETRMLVPTGKKRDPNAAKKRREIARVPDTARELDRHQLLARAGLDFALLTGDFNPIHWIRPYAKMAGFKSTILHGFGSLALCAESLNSNLFSGDVTKLRTLEVRFTRPVVLPGELRVYIDDGQLFAGAAPSGPAFMTGAFTHA